METPIPCKVNSIQAGLGSKENGKRRRRSAHVKSSTRTAELFSGESEKEFDNSDRNGDCLTAEGGEKLAETRSSKIGKSKPKVVEKSLPSELLPEQEETINIEPESGRGASAAGPSVPAPQKSNTTHLGKEAKVLESPVLHILDMGISILELVARRAENLDPREREKLSEGWRKVLEVTKEY